MFKDALNLFLQVGEKALDKVPFNTALIVALNTALIEP
jgi:hypothetical protein